MTPPPRTILVIGGGLGGLAFAQILQHSSVADKYKVVIYERDATPTNRGQGWRIAISEGGLSALSSIPHVADLLEMESKSNAVTFVDGELNVLLVSKDGVNRERMVGLANRWKLRMALVEGLNVEYGKKFVYYEETESNVTAYFEDGTQATGDLLIGADGARSIVRAQRCPELKLEQIPVVALIASVAATPAIKEKLPTLNRLIESTLILRVLARGGNSIVLYNYDTPDGQSNIIWAYTFSAAAAPNLPTEPKALKEVIDAHIAYFGSELATQVRDTPSENYVYGPRTLSSVVPTKENPLGKTTRVTLLGDSAHAMTPHRGMGANTAFADAVDLAQVLTHDGDNPWTGIAGYEKVMINRGFEIVRGSKQMTNVTHVVGGFKCFLRDLLFKSLGWALWSKQLVARLTLVQEFTASPKVEVGENSD